MKCFFLAILFASLFLVPALLTISDYNVNWDEPAHFIRGQAYLRYFLSGQLTYNSLPKFNKFDPYRQNKEKLKINLLRYSIYQDRSLDGTYWISKDEGHPVINGILSSLTNYIFFQKFGIIGDIESYHFFIIICASFLVGLIFYWSASEYGLFAGVISFLTISLYPLFIAESHNNIKDPVEATFFSFTIYTFYRATKAKSWKLFLLSSIFAGLALGTKFNILFVPFIIIPWLFIRYVKEIKRYKLSVIKKIPKSIMLSLFIYPIIAFSIFFGSWPFLWHDSIAHLEKIFGFYKGIGTNNIYFQNFFNPYASEWILFTTPIVTLILTTTGIICACFLMIRDRKNIVILWLLWIFVPIARVSSPNTNIYGGIRQIMEFVPAAALLAGFGGYKLQEIILKKTKRKAMYKNIILVLITVLFIPSLIKLVAIHPNQDLYFNELIGGLPGAVKRNFPEWGATLGNQYLQAVKWLNKYAEPNSILTLDVGVITNIPTSELREDITFANVLKSLTFRKGEYIIGLAYYGVSLPYDAQYPRVYLNPVHEVKVEGIPIAMVWKNDVIHTKKGYLNEIDITNLAKLYKENATIKIELNKVVRLTKIELSYDNSSCGPDDKGTLATSINGSTWKQETEGLLDQQILQVHKSIYDGEITHLFAAIPTKYLKIYISPENSCLLKNTTARVFSLQN